ncbi:MAG: zf-TFIIB domain-containing protein [candidate division Zixibacteria bacterium]|nr:zf-TFIIB domain-containing protein [candidate division Zixibacteria bacterium]
MECPVDKSPMIVLELNMIEIDFCTECSGIWLDSGELELLVGDTEEAAAMIGSFKSDASSTERKIKCPICRKKMEKVIYSPSENIRIDRCVNGHGLWFDKGELHDIINSQDFEGKTEVVELLRDIFKN